MDSTVRATRIIETIWGEHPPRNATNTVQSYVSRIRRALRPYTGPDTDPLITVASGYRLCMNPMTVDLHVFRALLERAATARRNACAEDAVEDLEMALGLWREDVFADLDEAVRLRMKSVPLARYRRRAVIELADITAELDQVERAIGALETQTELDPTDEPVHARLMLAYAATGRRAAALSVFDSIRTVLADTLGVDPSAELRQAYTKVLRL